jgi:hypothetical protein
MGSWVRCKCDGLLHRNLFAGTGVSIVATEEFLALDRPKASADDLVSELVRTGERLLRCRTCGRIVLLNETTEDIRFFKPDSAD